MQLQALGRQPGAVLQRLAREFELVGGCQHLGLQAARARRGLVAVGDRLVAQGVAVLGLGVGLVNRQLLLLQQRQPAFGQQQLEIALCGQQHPVLLRGLPFEIGGVGRQRQLALLGPALGAVERLARAQAPARGRAALDRGAERHAGRIAKARGGKLRAVHPAVGARIARAGAQAQGRTPERGGLLAPGGTGGAGRVNDLALWVMLARGLPDLQQVGGSSDAGGHGAEREQRAGNQGAVSHACAP